MSDNRPIITAYCLDWHLHSSGSMHDLLINALSDYADIRQRAWDGEEALPPPRPDETTIFYIRPPSEAWLAQHNTPTVWIPMADAISYPPNIVNHPQVRIVAFSGATYQLAQDLGVPAFRLTYFPNPANFPPADHSGERVLLYWNRTGLFHQSFLLRLCKELRVDRLIFKNVTDPNLPDALKYDLPDRVGNMVIEKHTQPTSYADYLALLRRATIFIAPRLVEGVGIAFLEAMASGCAVFGFNDVAMNEYIQTGENGYLFDRLGAMPSAQLTQALDKWFFHMVYRRVVYRTQKRTVFYPYMSLFQDWRTVRGLDIAQLGESARASMVAGYDQWVNRLPAYADFVLKGVLS